MSETLSNHRELRWSNEAKTMIDMVVTYSDPTIGDIPFSAQKDDVEEYGREMFENAVKGLYGDIAPYDKFIHQPEHPDNPANQIPVGVV
jgi:hypothetical protein